MPAKFVLLGLQGAVASGAEPTFDAQPMERGVHLRWGFARELGFPPGGFWLYRRVAPPGETVVTPPRELGPPARLEWGPPARTLGLHFTDQGLRFDLDDTLLPADIAGRPGSTRISPPCLHFTTAHAGPRFRVTITFPLPVHLDAIESGEIVGSVEFPNVGAPAWLADGAPVVFGSSVAQPTGLFLQSAARVDHPITQLAVDVSARGTYLRSIAFTPVNACAIQPGPARAAWGPADPDGWSRWLTPFELPLTRSGWPSRWSGAPDPATTPSAALEAADVGEAKRRLNGQRLDPARSPAQEDADLLALRGALSRLVAGFPSHQQQAVPAVPPGSAPPDAPAFTLTLLDQLFLATVNPHVARVLGLYHVDRTAVAGQTYDYCIAACWEGWWGRELPVRFVIPGLAAPDALARGKARYDGLLMTSPVPMWRAMTSPVAIEAAVPPAVAGAFQAVIAAGGFAVPPALLGMQAPPTADVSIPAGTIRFVRPTAALDVQCAGTGGVQAQLADGSVLPMQSVASAALTALRFVATDPMHNPIVALSVFLPRFSPREMPPFVIGAIALYPVATGTAVVQYALLHAPGAMTPPTAPPKPAAFFRHRAAEVDPAGPGLRPRSLFEIQWPAPAASDQSGDPLTGMVPPPGRAVAFMAERTDTGRNGTVLLPRFTLAVSQVPPRTPLFPSWVPVDPPPANAPRVFRFTDSHLVDPAGQYSWRVAGFGPFGEIGPKSPPSDPVGVVRLAPSPSRLEVIGFDNTAAAGGAPSATGDAWTGGRLRARVAWSGSAFLACPDGKGARALVLALDQAGPPPLLATADLVLPPPAITAVTVTAITPIAGGLQIATSPALPVLAPEEPAAQLVIAGPADPDGIRSFESYAVRPAGAPVVVPAGDWAPVRRNPAAYQGPAWLVRGLVRTIDVAVPLRIPIDQTSVRAELAVFASAASPPDGVPAPQDVDKAARPRPAVFTAPQRLRPPPPPTPVHAVHHQHYEPCDVHGMAELVLSSAASPGRPFDMPTLLGVAGYVGLRASVSAVGLADMKRRLLLGAAGLTDPQPAIAGRADLARFISDLPEWLAAYNSRRGGAPLAVADVFKDRDARNAFSEHFHDGLLDDELRALADVATPGGNLAAFGRIGAPTIARPLTDTIDGRGFARVLYKFAAVNAAGAASDVTPAAGPFYTRPAVAPRRPVLHTVRGAPAGVIVSWVIDDGPDALCYLVYRAADPASLSDLRYFGPDPLHPLSPGALAAISYLPTAAPPVQLSATGAVDPRLVGLVPDPRLFARDYDDSDMAEVPLPGPAPDGVLGVWRLAEYDPAAAPNAQHRAFNYWRPPARGGVSQVVQAGGSARIVGLRVGLGRGVPVVVALTRAGRTEVLGALPVRRAAFLDASGPTPADPHAVRTWTPAAGRAFYAVVAVDLFGNRSAASSIAAAQSLPV